MMYNKKVLEHFRKPHNYGKIKDYDGLGKVGNPVCLAPTEKIHTLNDILSLNNLNKGNLILSHRGIDDKIESTSKRNYSGKIVELKNQLGKVILTPEHLVLAMKVPGGDKFLRTKNRKLLIPAWYHAVHLKRGDIILYPVVKKVINTGFIEINIPKSEYDFCSIEVNSKVKLDADILKLFGYFLAEGSISDKKCKNFLTFTLNIKEDDIVDDIKRAAKKFGLNITIKKKPEKKTVDVFIYSATLARYFKTLFGKYAYGKSIPEFLMTLPPNKQKYLLYGMWKGDGYVNLDRDGPRAGYATISYKIAQQLKILLLRQGIIPSIYREEDKIVNGVHHKVSYRIHIGQADSLKKMCKIMKVNYHPKIINREKSWIDNKYLYTTIKNMTVSNYSGQVCNLEVEKAHSFTTESFCVHNCGDEMYLYIKIGNNKKKEEVIKDIKFETFGCVAAIATSSVITDLVKGKTIAQALKATKGDIVKVLGELPPIKLHCSVLAIDALSEAVYDYFLKNKKEISDDLKKKHEIIQKHAKEELAGCEV